MTSEAERLRRTIEVCVYAPIGVALWVRDLAPNFVNMFVARGRAEVTKREEQVHQRLRTVRGAGEVALAFGVPAVRDKLHDRMQPNDAGRPTGSPTPVDTPGDDSGGGAGERIEVDAAGREPAAPNETAAPKAGRSNHRTTAGNDTTTNGANGTTVNGTGTNGSGAHPPQPSASLAIPGYDALSASQVVERLAGLDTAELVAVRDYELAHRQRRTILGKIDQLAAG